MAAATAARPILPPLINRRRTILLLPGRPISSRLFSSKNPNQELNSSNNDENQEIKKPIIQENQNSILHQSLPSHYSPVKNYVPVFVTLPKDSVDLEGKRMLRKRAMAASFAAMAAVGVEGVSVEVWWGVVEREKVGVYDWDGYLEVFQLAARFKLKVRAVMAFHQGAVGPKESQSIPLPLWVLEEMDKDPDLAYCDRFGRRNKEYISLGCDSLPLLKGRTPIQVYSDFMRSFRDTFRDFLGVIVTEIQVGMGPAGELRYPSTPFEILNQMGGAINHGEFQCYDKHMLSSLSACAEEAGMEEWGHGCPLSPINNLLHDSEIINNFFSDNGSWNTSYGRFFLEWYSSLLLLHGERLCSATEAIFLHTGIKISAKIAGIHWHFYTCSHPSELTAGYYNTLTRDGYLPIARMFSRYDMTLCCTCFDMRDTETSINSKSSPEGYLRQLINAARLCNLALCGENSVTRIDDASIKQVIKSSRIYFDGAHQPSLSFTYVRMDKNVFEAQNWNRFTRLVRRMSDSRTFYAKLNSRIESCVSCASGSDELGRALTFH